MEPVIRPDSDLSMDSLPKPGALPGLGVTDPNADPRLLVGGGNPTTAATSPETNGEPTVKAPVEVLHPASDQAPQRPRRTGVPTILPPSATAIPNAPTSPPTPRRAGEELKAPAPETPEQAAARERYEEAQKQLHEAVAARPKLLREAQAKVARELTEHDALIDLLKAEKREAAIEMNKLLGV